MREKVTWICCPPSQNPVWISWTEFSGKLECHGKVTLPSWLVGSKINKPGQVNLTYLTKSKETADRPVGLRFHGDWLKLRKHPSGWFSLFKSESRCHEYFLSIFIYSEKIDGLLFTFHTNLRFKLATLQAAFNCYELLPAQYLRMSLKFKTLRLLSCTRKGFNLTHRPLHVIHSLPFFLSFSSGYNLIKQNACIKSQKQQICFLHTCWD